MTTDKSSLIAECRWTSFLDSPAYVGVAFIRFRPIFASYFHFYFNILGYADGRSQNLSVLFRHPGQNRAGKVGVHTEHAQIFLFFREEKLVLRVLRTNFT